MKKISKIAYNEKAMGIVFIMPLILYFLVFQLAPMFIAFIVSLTEWNLRSDMKFVGLKNYIDLFNNRLLYPHFWSSLFVTIKYILIFVPGSVIVSLIVATLLNSDIKGEGFYKVTYYIPNVTSGVAVAAMWVYMLDPQFGLINLILGTNISFLNKAETALPSIAIMGIWTTLGYNVLILLSAMKGVSPSIYEASKIDGASWLKTFTKITIPMIMPTIFFLIITSMISSFQIFDQMYLMTKGAHGTRTFMLYLYDHAFRHFQMGVASAMSYILLLIILLITYIQFKIVPQKLD